MKWHTSRRFCSARRERYARTHTSHHSVGDYICILLASSLSRVFQLTGDFFGLLLRRCTECVVYVKLGVTGASDALIKDDFRFAESAGFFRGVSCAAEDCSCFQSSTLTVTLAPLLFSETGDRCRALARLLLPLGDVAPPRPPAPADFSLPLPLFPDLPELFLGVGLIVSSAYAKSMAPAFGSMSSPPFSLHEIEQ